MKTHLQAAALLAATAGLGLTAQATENRSITQCVPVYENDGILSIVAPCDAAPINKKYKLRINPKTGCSDGEALQVPERGRAIAWRQVPFLYIHEEGQKPPLRQCSEDEALSFIIEL